MRVNLGEIYSQKITIINKLDAKDSSEKMDSYFKHEIDRCMWEVQTVRTVEESGTVTVGTSHIVQIPEDADYLPYKEWAKLEDRGDFFTIRNGDYVVKGEVAEEVNATNIRKVIDIYEPEAFQVQTFRDATKKDGFVHATKGIKRFLEPYIIEG